MNVYGYDDNYSGITNVGIVYVRADENLSAGDIENIRTLIQNYMDKVSYSSTTVFEVTKDSNETVTVKATVYNYQTTNSGESYYTELTNKNRVSFTLSGKKSLFTTGSYSNLYCFAVAKIKDDTTATEGTEGTWYVSDNYTHYVNGEQAKQDEQDEQG
jgi:hypothetical protein